MLHNVAVVQCAPLVLQLVCCVCVLFVIWSKVQLFDLLKKRVKSFKYGECVASKFLKLPQTRRSGCISVVTTYSGSLQKKTTTYLFGVSQHPLFHYPLSLSLFQVVVICGILDFRGGQIFHNLRTQNFHHHHRFKSSYNEHSFPRSSCTDIITNTSNAARRQYTHRELTKALLK